MKLNPDCIRDILIDLESVCTGQNAAVYTADKPLEVEGRKYEFSELHYHLQQCEMMGFFVKPSFHLDGGCTIKDISPTAHAFLANMRSDTVWNNTKSVAKKIGITSLNALVQISSNVVTSIIKAQFGLV